jgi:hypothetical protein
MEPTSITPPGVLDTTITPLDPPQLTAGRACQLFGVGIAIGAALWAVLAMIG